MRLVGASNDCGTHPASSTPLPQRKRTAQCPSTNHVAVPWPLGPRRRHVSMRPRGRTGEGPMERERGRERKKEGKKEKSNTTYSTEHTELVHGTQHSSRMPGSPGRRAPTYLHTQVERLQPLPVCYILYIHMEKNRQSDTRRYESTWPSAGPTTRTCVLTSIHFRGGG